MVKGIENIEIIAPVANNSDVVKDCDLIVDKALMDDGRDLYNRQSTLGIVVPHHITVIGVGGVGSWVALNFALIGVSTITLIDADKIDVSNLNRTMFKTSNVGQYKTVAMKDLILERRPHCIVYSYTKKFEELPDSVQKIASNTTTIDCRDSIKHLDKVKSPIIGGYNGLSATIHIQPDLKHIWGEEESPYTIIPSYVIVPEVIAAMIVNHVCVESTSKTAPKEKIMNIDFKKLVSNLDQKDPEATKDKTTSASSAPKKRAPRKRAGEV
jgi:hypothetical protein